MFGKVKENTMADWPGFRRCPANCARASRTKKKNAATVSRAELGGIIWGTAVIDSGGRIYVGSSNRAFCCIDPDAWRAAWTYRITVKADSLIDSAAVLCPELSLVVVPGGDGILHALDAASGKTRWTFSAQRHGAQRAIVDSFEGNVQHHGGRLFAGSDNGTMYCVDARTGAALWHLETGMMVWSCACVLHGGAYVAFGSLDGAVYVVDAASGRTMDKHRTGADVKTSPTALGESAFCCCNSNGKMTCFDVTHAGRMAVRWSVDLCHYEIYSSPLRIDEYHVIACDMGGFMHCVDLASGQTRWKISLGDNDPIMSSPILVDSYVVVGDSGGRLHAVDPRDHSAGYSLPLGRQALNASPAYSSYSDSVVIGSYDGGVYSVPLDRLLSPEMRVDRRWTREPSLQASMVTPGSETATRFGIMQLRLRVPDVPEAAILDYRQDDSSTTVLKSSDSKCLNLLNRGNGAKNVAVQGRWYRQTGAWWKDRLVSVFGDKRDFRTHVRLPWGDTEKTPSTSLSATTWVLSNLKLAQPVALNTYIPAAMNAMAFAARVSAGHVVLQTAILSDVPGEVILEQSSVGQTVTLRITEREPHGLLAESTAPFDLSVMGGTLRLQRVRVALWREGNGVVGELMGMGPCTSVKGNGKSYTIPSDIVTQVCDARLQATVLASFDGVPLKRAQA